MARTKPEPKVLDREDILTCRRCKKTSKEYRAYVFGLCDECVVEGYRQLQEAINLTQPECGGIKIDPDHYPIEDHPEFYGIRWQTLCECEGCDGKDSGVWEKVK